MRHSVLWGKKISEETFRELVSEKHFMDPISCIFNFLLISNHFSNPVSFTHIEKH